MRGVGSVAVRRAAPADLAWANARYAEAGFLASDATHLLLIAEMEGALAGLGRLVPAGEGAVELGGMFVLPAARGRGVSRALVRALLAAAGAARVFCIPFDDLAGLYEREGFVRVPAEADVPPAVAAKLAWCRDRYARPACLLEHVPGAGNT